MRHIILAFLLLILPSSAFAVVGDTVRDCQSIGAGAWLDIVPPAAQEYVVQNIYYPSTISLERFDGVNAVTFGSFSGPDFIQVIMRVTSGNRLRIKNTSGSPQFLCYDGLQVK